MKTFTPQNLEKSCTITSAYLESAEQIHITQSTYLKPCFTLFYKNQYEMRLAVLNFSRIFSFNCS